jgi:uncharacterized protein
MYVSEHRPVGHLTEVNGHSMVAQLANDSLPPATANMVGQIGSYILLQQAEIKVLGIIQKNWERTFFDPQGRRQTERYIQLIPVGEIDAKQQFIRGVRHYPVPGAPLYNIDLKALQAIFAKFQDYQFFIGELSQYRAYQLSLDPKTLFGRHFAILGQSGSGKSWTVTSLIQNTLKNLPQTHLILLDLHGEYCWRDKEGRLVSAFPDETVNYLDATELELPYWMMSYADLIDLLIDKNDKNASMQQAFLRETLQTLKRKEAKNIGLESVSIDTPIYFSLAELYMQFKTANEERRDFGKTQGSLYGQFDEFLVRLQSRFNDVRYDFLLKPKTHNNSDSMADLLRELVGLGHKRASITVVDLSSVPTDVRPAVSAQIGRLVYEFNYWNPRRREFPITLICEEAHAYIPRDNNSQFQGTRKMMERIAKEGRKYGVSIGVVSQRPTELSETMLSQCSSFICLRITNPDDQAYVRKLVPEAEGDLTDILTSLGRGEALILGEAAPVASRVQIFKPNPEPRSNDVDYYTYWRSGPADLDVEHIVGNWRNQIRESH